MTSWAGSTEVQGKVGLTAVFNWLCDLSLHAESESAGGTYCLAGKCPGGDGPHFPTVALEQQVYPAPSFGGRQATATFERPEAPITLRSFDLTLKRIASAPQNKRPRSQHATSQPPPGGSLATHPGTLSIGPACLSRHCAQSKLRNLRRAGDGRSPSPCRRDKRPCWCSLDQSEQKFVGWRQG